jgi:transposase-like protein
MIQCKGCGSKSIVKNGFVRKKQRYRCKICALNFVPGDARTSREVAMKKAFCVLMYGLGKASFSMLGKLLGHSPAMIYRWVRAAMDKTEEPEISADIREIEFDDTLRCGILWAQKKTSSGSSKPWIAARGELFPGLPAAVMLQPSKDSMKKSDT